MDFRPQEKGRNTEVGDGELGGEAGGVRGSALCFPLLLCLQKVPSRGKSGSRGEEPTWFFHGFLTG